MKPIRMALQGKAEMATTPGQIMLQFSPLPNASGLPFHIHVPAGDAQAFVVGGTYTITIKETK